MKYYNYPDPRGTEVAEDVDSKNISEVAPSELPDTSDASVGNALVLDENKKPVWGKGGGGDSVLRGKIYIVPNASTSINSNSACLFSLSEENVYLSVTDADNKTLNIDNITIVSTGVSSVFVSSNNFDSLVLCGFGVGSENKHPWCKLRNVSNTAVSVGSSNMLLAYNIWYKLNS